MYNESFLDSASKNDRKAELESNSFWDFLKPSRALILILLLYIYFREKEIMNDGILIILELADEAKQWIVSSPKAKSKRIKKLRQKSEEKEDDPEAYYKSMIQTTIKLTNIIKLLKKEMKKMKTKNS